MHASFGRRMATKTKSWMLYRLEHVLGFVYKQELREVITKDEDGNEIRKQRYVLIQQPHRKPELSTAEVSKALKISVPVLERWRADPIFQNNEVAVQDENRRWIWDREKTTVWVIAAMRLDPKNVPPSIQNDDSELETARNPAYGRPVTHQRRLPNRKGRFYKDVTLSLAWDEARRQLGMDTDYTFGKHSE